MYNINKLIPESQFKKLLNILPTPKQKVRGRKRADKRALASGIIQVLFNGTAWRKIAECGCSPVTCWRYFKEVQRRGKLKLLFKCLATGKTDITEGTIDTTTVTSFRFKGLTGWDGKNKKCGTKISLLSDKFGLPADVEFGKGNKHDTAFVERHLKKTSGRRKRMLNLDKGYTGAEFRRKMRNKGTKINMETKQGDYVRKRGPKFKFDKEKYKVRFLVERLNAWLKNFWRIRIRRDYKASMFKAFVYIALIIILIRN